MSERQGLGARGEQLAADWLRARGCVIVARNLRFPPYGEIDIVAERDGVRLLVEVRTRRGDAFGPAVASLSAAKRRRMLAAALAYAATFDQAPPLQIDLLAVQLDRQGRLVAIERLANVVEDASG